MSSPFSFTNSLQSLVDGVSDWFGDDEEDEAERKRRRAAAAALPEPEVEFRSLFNEQPVLETVTSSGPRGVAEVIRQPSLVDDAADPRFPAFQKAWRDGKPVEDLLGDTPFGLKSKIAGNGGDNRRPDVAKVQVLLNKAGFHEIPEAEGPNGYHSIILDQDIRRFQRANKLKVDGALSPGGETIRALERTLSTKTTPVAPAPDMPKRDAEMGEGGVPTATAAPAFSPPTDGSAPPPVLHPMGQKPRPAADWESEARFETLVKPIFKEEGGYVNDPLDKGGETNFGITAETLRNYQARYGRNLGPNNQPIFPKELKKEDGKEIYRNEFFYGQRLHEIKSPAIATVMLDAGVLQGPSRSWRFMQETLNSIDGENSLVVDGIGGSKTINKINRLPPDKISEFIKYYTRLRREEIEYYVKSKPSQTRYEKGWGSRLDRVMQRALAYTHKES